MTPILGITASSITSSTLGDFESIATVTVGSGGQATVVFDNIPQIYQHLQIRALARSTNVNAGGESIRVRLNNDTGNNYARHVLSGDGATATSAAASSANFGTAGYVSTSGYTNIFGVFVLDILDYTNTNKNRTLRSLTGYDANGAGVAELRSNLYNSTTAVTRIDLYIDSYNFAQYSHFALYGIKG